MRPTVNGLKFMQPQSFAVIPTSESLCSDGIRKKKSLTLFGIVHGYTTFLTRPKKSQKKIVLNRL